MKITSHHPENVRCLLVRGGWVGITINMLGCSEYFVNKTYLGRRAESLDTAASPQAGSLGPGNIKHLVKLEE